MQRQLRLPTRQQQHTQLSGDQRFFEEEARDNDRLASQIARFEHHRKRVGDFKPSCLQKRPVLKKGRFESSHCLCS